MKKILVLSISLFAALFLKANPLIPTPFLITELYFDNNDKWTMELLIKDPIYNLNTFKLVTSSGEFLFKTGISVSQNAIILITSDSMQTPLALNRLGDYIEIKSFISGLGWFDVSVSLRYGNAVNASLSYPRIGQSIGLIIKDHPSPPSPVGGTDYFYVKRDISTLGYFPNYCISNCYGIFNGYVYDQNNHPVPSDSILFNFLPNTFDSWNTIQPNSSGYFSRDMYARNYNIRIYYPKLAAIPYLDTIISIEPDSTVSCVFHINNYISGIHDLKAMSTVSISTYPNPFKTNVTLIIKLPASIDYSKAIIKFFNNFGEIVKIIPVQGLNKSTETYHISLSVNDNFNFNSGTYYYVLEVNGEKLASNKMTLVR